MSKEKTQPTYNDIVHPTIGYEGPVKDPRVYSLEVAGFKFNVVTCCFLKENEFGLISIRAEDVYNLSCKELAELVRRKHNGQEEKG